MPNSAVLTAPNLNQDQISSNSNPKAQDRGFQINDRLMKAGYSQDDIRAHLRQLAQNDIERSFTGTRLEAAKWLRGEFAHLSGNGTIGEAVMDEMIREMFRICDTLSLETIALHLGKMSGLLNQGEVAAISLGADNYQLMHLSAPEQNPYPMRRVSGITEMGPLSIASGPKFGWKSDLNSLGITFGRDVANDQKNDTDERRKRLKNIQDEILDIKKTPTVEELNTLRAELQNILDEMVLESADDLGAGIASIERMIIGVEDLRSMLAGLGNERDPKKALAIRTALINEIAALKVRAESLPLEVEAAAEKVVFVEQEGAPEEGRINPFLIAQMTEQRIMADELKDLQAERKAWLLEELAIGNVTEAAMGVSLLAMVGLVAAFEQMNLSNVQLPLQKLQSETSMPDALTKKFRAFFDRNASVEKTIHAKAESRIGRAADATQEIEDLSAVTDTDLQAVVVRHEQALRGQLAVGSISIEDYKSQIDALQIIKQVAADSEHNAPTDDMRTRFESALQQVPGLDSELAGNVVLRGQNMAAEVAQSPSTEAVTVDALQDKLQSLVNELQNAATANDRVTPAQSAQLETLQAVQESLKQVDPADKMAMQQRIDAVLQNLPQDMPAEIRAQIKQNLQVDATDAAQAQPAGQAMAETIQDKLEALVRNREDASPQNRAQIDALQTLQANLKQVDPADPVAVQNQIDTILHDLPKDTPAEIRARIEQDLKDVAATLKDQSPQSQDALKQDAKTQLRETAKLDLTDTVLTDKNDGKISSDLKNNGAATLSASALEDEFAMLLRTGQPGKLSPAQIAQKMPNHPLAQAYLADQKRLADEQARVANRQPAMDTPAATPAQPVDAKDKLNVSLDGAVKISDLADASRNATASDVKLTGAGSPDAPKPVKAVEAEPRPVPAQAQNDFVQTYKTDFVAPVERREQLNVNARGETQPAQDVKETKLTAPPPADPVQKNETGAEKIPATIPPTQLIVTPPPATDLAGPAPASTTLPPAPEPVNGKTSLNSSSPSDGLTPGAGTAPTVAPPPSVQSPIAADETTPAVGGPIATKTDADPAKTVIPPSNTDPATPAGPNSPNDLTAGGTSPTGTGPVPVEPPLEPTPGESNPDFNDWSRGRGRVRGQIETDKAANDDSPKDEQEKRLNAKADADRAELERQQAEKDARDVEKAAKDAELKHPEDKSLRQEAQDPPFKDRTHPLPKGWQKKPSRELRTNENEDELLSDNQVPPRRKLLSDPIGDIVKDCEGDCDKCLKPCAAGSASRKSNSLKGKGGKFADPVSAVSENCNHDCDNCTEPCAAGAAAKKGSSLKAKGSKFDA